MDGIVPSATEQLEYQMSHDIDMSNGRANVAYTGDVPWHGLGVNLGQNTDVDAWRAAAGLDFVVKLAEMDFKVIAGDDVCPTVIRRPLPFSRASYRTDTMQPLGLVSKRYKIVQPREVTDFFLDWAAKGEMKLEVAGSLAGGRKVWALARHEYEMNIMGDISRPYFLLTTSYDGEMATVGTFLATRVVCANTMAMAMHEVKRDGMDSGDKNPVSGNAQGFYRTGFSIPHIREFKADEAKRHVAQLIEAAKQYELNGRKLATTGSNDDVAMRYFVGLVGVKNKDGDDLTRHSREKAELLFNLYKNGPGSNIDSARGTVWGLLNAVTRYVDHEAGQRNPGGRLNSAWYGAGKDLKSEAYGEAMRIASGGDDFGRLMVA